MDLGTALLLILIVVYIIALLKRSSVGEGG
jgi:hypothetical protein